MNQITVTGFRLKLYPKDFTKVRAFYEQTLGLVVINEWDRGEQDRGVMFQVGPAIIELLSPEASYVPIAGADLSLEVANVQELWQILKDKADIVFALRDNDWGDSSFCIKDPEGFEITFFTPQENKNNLSDITDFMRAYEAANNSHVFANVEPFIADDATYWFTDGSYAGIDEIRQAVENTFNKIQDEVYEISDLKWLVKSENTAVCTYRFSWQGTVDGKHQSGSGRGTNVLQKRDGLWQITHEHLSNDDRALSLSPSINRPTL